MEYKHDWDKSKKRFNAFWNNEIIDRCCIAVTAPKNDMTKVNLPENEEDRLKYWTDGESIVKRYKRYFENTYFGGEAFPQVFLRLGAGGHAGFF